jgi:hypothetical protein
MRRLIPRVGSAILALAAPLIAIVARASRFEP